MRLESDGSRAQLHLVRSTALYFRRFRAILFNDALSITAYYFSFDHEIRAWAESLDIWYFWTAATMDAFHHRSTDS